MRCSRTALLIVVGAALVIRAEEGQFPVKARVSVDKDAIKIGERLTYTITMEAEGDVMPALPDIPEKLGEFDVLDVKREPPVIGVDKTLAKVTCVLTSYEVGKRFIPPTEIQYKLKDGTVGTIMTKDVPVEVVSVLPPEEKMEDIRDIRGLIAFTAMSDILLLILGAILILLLVGMFVAVVLLRRRREKPVETRALTAHEIALAELEKLRKSGLIAAGKIQEFYYRLSDIERHYIEDRFTLRAPERTTEEFLIEMAQTDLLLSVHKSLLGDFLARCDLVKYAKQTPRSSEIDDACAAAEKFIIETKRSPDEREEKAA